MHESCTAVQAVPVQGFACRSTCEVSMVKFDVPMAAGYGTRASQLDGRHDRTHECAVLCLSVVRQRADAGAVSAMREPWASVDLLQACGCL